MEESRSTFTREAGTDSWYTEVGGERVYLPGKVELRANGDLAIEQRDHSWKVEEPSGAVRSERILPNHALIDLNGDGTVNSIRRPDGSQVHCQHENGRLTVVEEKDSRSNQARTWRLEGDLWQCSDSSEKPRRNLQVTAEGTVTFKTEDGLDRSVRIGGETTTTGTGRSGTIYDSNGQLSRYVFPDGTSRGFTCDASGTVNRFIEYDASGAVDRTFTRDGDKYLWNVTDRNGRPAGVYHGEFATDSRGGWSSLDITEGTKPEDLRWSAAG